MNNNTMEKKYSQREFQHDIEEESGYSGIKTASVLFVWGTLIVAVVLYGLYHFYTYQQFQESQRAALNAEYPDQTERIERDQQLLNSLERIPDSEDRFRIPVDSAFTLLTSDHQP
ncbi:hypothetical protein QLX67_09485 [Balneolaceae bacterium ANBcel3]|nr:hypothetical protein [Balneolaceae bacterium ANBcel3]